MKLTITETALEKIQALQDEAHRYIVLYYDTVGIGCKLNGIPTVRLAEEPRARDIKVESETIPALVNVQQEVFFAEEVKLDFSNNVFRLSSKEGFLNALIPQAHLTHTDFLDKNAEAGRGDSC
ncbi:iron-sulfur cluster biosynthesis family protein [Terribacillus sp. 179-K 1B1 HS]|uniref:iron-sulfur cluster biosynthesis family protein n=1 Tax=Terribacillus sp. 179-K 1B1 HS TaxID=3142388 RepID=UPI00399F3076